MTLPPPQSLSDEARDALARRFLRDARVGTLGHPLIAVVTALLVYGPLGPGPAATLVVFLLLATTARALLLRTADLRDPGRAVRLTSVATAVSAVAWALALLWLVPRVPPATQGRLMVVAAGLVAAATATHVAHRASFHRYATVVLGTLGVALLLWETQDADRLADLGLVAVFWAVMAMLYRQAHLQLVEHVFGSLSLREARDAAGREKEFLDALVSSAPDIVLFVDPRDRFVRASDDFSRLFGHDPSDVLDRPVAELAGDDEAWAEVARAVEDARAGGRGERELTWRRPGDRTAHLRLLASLGRGAARGWVFVLAQDLTRLRGAQEKLRATQADYRLLVEAAHDLIWRMDVEGRWSYLNPATESIYGLPPESLLGERALDRAPRRRRAADRRAFRRLLAGEEVVEHETVHARADGTPVHLSFSARPRFDDEGRVVGAQGIARNITARVEARRALEELAEKSSLVRSLINNTSDLIFYKDAEGVYRGCNQAFADFLGITEAQIVGRTDRDVFAPDRAVQYQTSDEEAFTSGQPFRMEEWVRFPDGTRRRLDTVKTAFYTEDGKRLGILGISRDVTHRKEQEDRVLEMAEQAERATRMKSAFLANMSHEIRTPMNGVIGMTELLLDTDLTDAQRQYLDVVRASADHLLAILNDVLDFSKIEAGHMELEVIPFDLQDEVTAAVRVLGIPAARRGNELALDIRPGVPHGVVGDPGRLRQVLTNLVSNASKFTENGEIVIKVEEVDEAALPEGILPTEGGDGPFAAVRFSVSDTGIGIPAEKQAAIFQEFTQADSSVTREYGGTGLGLAISRRLLELMGGRLALDSAVGRGSTFSFVLPFTTVANWVAADEGVDTAALEGVRALVVDDHETNRRIVREFLAGAGAEVVEVSGAPEALERFGRAERKGKPFGLAVLDVQMPGMDGLELASRLRSPDGAAVPLVLLTSGNRPGDAARARALGVAAYLVKPVVRAELLRASALALAGGTATRFEGAFPPPAEGGVQPLGPAPARRGRVRVLLAEDNRVNQQVAVAVLSRAGHEVHVVENGRAAVEAVRRGSFDLVLMDLQMPELDGLEATRDIRAFAAPKGRTPIVALTAHALDEERERCLAAGMDDFVAKPFRPAELVEAVERWTGRPGPSAEPADADGDPPPPVPAGAPAAFPVQAEPPADLVTFRSTMREAGVEAVVEPTLRVFLEESPGRIEDLRHALADRDARAVRSAAHGLKSSARNVHASGLGDLLERVEAAARRDDLATAQGLFPGLEQAYERVQAYIEASLETVDGRVEGADR